MVQDKELAAFSQRLRSAAAARGWPEHGLGAELARAAKVTPKASSKWLNGESIPRPGRLALIAAALGVPRVWLQYGEGPVDLPETDGAPVPAAGERDGIAHIPQYDTGGMGGTGLILRDQPGVIRSWSVNMEWLRANVPSCTSATNLCIVTGFGDSMPDTYSPGDPVLVDLGVAVCDHDGVYFFRVGDEGFIKRLQRIPGQGIRVLSQNKEYEAWTITDDMDFEVFGKVLRAWKGKNY